LADQLPAVLKGEVELNAPERLDYARVCALKKHFVASARLSQEAFAEDPPLAEEWERGYRYAAACAAARAGCGLGQEAHAPDHEASVRWRKQALDWLRADLALANRLLRAGPRSRAAVQQRLTFWQRDANLHCLRDAVALRGLPQAERQAWLDLWTEVEVLLVRARGPMNQKARPE
jgi:hypothetical protein